MVITSILGNEYLRIKQDDGVLEDRLWRVKLKILDDFSGNNAVMLNFISICMERGFSQCSESRLLHNVGWIAKLLANEGFVMVCKIYGDIVGDGGRVAIDHDWRSVVQDGLRTKDGFG